MATDFLTVRRGVNLDLYFDTYTDDTQTTRISYTGWRFVVTLDAAGIGGEDLVYATDDTSPALTVVDATNPTGKRLALHVDAVATARIPAASSTLFLTRVDPADSSNTELIADPVPVSVQDGP